MTTNSSVIPVRSGNGIMEQLEREGHFSRPTLPQLEAVLAYGLGLQGGRVFADLWDIEALARCAICGGDRVARLQAMNRHQKIPPSVSCECDV